MTDRQLYNPKNILEHPEFKILNEKPAKGTGKNIALAYDVDHVNKFVEKPRLDPAPGQVEVKVRATGICGSDVHFSQHGHIGDMVVRCICGAGHESAGKRFEIGGCYLIKVNR